MIASLRGTVLERHPPTLVLVEVAGVGYGCTVLPRTFAELEPTSPAFLYCHHQVREDAQQLFGFLTRLERDTFETLLSVHGVGPSLAMAILAVHDPGSLASVVSAADHDGLTAVPGVGRKTAERLVIELRNRLGSGSTALDGGVEGSSATAVVRDALLGLGYSVDEVRAVMATVDPAADAEQMLRRALAAMGRSRA